MATLRWLPLWKRRNQIVKAWTELYPLSYPPSIINISDGEPTDG